MCNRGEKDLSDENTELQRRIGILERKIQREQKARNLAEQELEKYSRENYQTNQSLQRSLGFAKKKQAELAYLAEASSEVTSDISLKSLLVNTVSLTGQFLEADLGFCIYCRDGEMALDSAEIAYENLDIDKPDALVNDLLNLLPDANTENADTWLITEFESSQMAHACWMVYTNFRLRKGSSVWIVFISQSEFLDEESLYVLDTARGHLLSGIKRRLNKVRILKRNIELQETIDHLEFAKRQLVQSEKMASLGQLAAGVAHEINNPIGFIRSNSEVLGDYVDDFKAVITNVRKEVSLKGELNAEDLRRIVSKVDLDYLVSDSDELLRSNLDGLDRVREIVENLKTFSHSGDGKFEQISLNECISGALKITNNAFKYKHNVELNLPPELPYILGNKGQMQQVFVNLFVNAAQAMIEKGTLSITGTYSPEKVVIDVTDTGVGMDEKSKNKLFTPFFTTKEVGVGTGLGLSVSYAILESHHASVDVISVIGKGTTFRLLFPLTD